MSIVLSVFRNFLDEYKNIFPQIVVTPVDFKCQLIQKFTQLHFLKYSVR